MLFQDLSISGREKPTARHEPKCTQAPLISGRVACAHLALSVTGSRGQVAAKRAEAERRRQAEQDAEDRLNAKLEREQAPPGSGERSPRG